MYQGKVVARRGEEEMRRGEVRWGQGRVETGRQQPELPSHWRLCPGRRLDEGPLYYRLKPLENEGWRQRSSSSSIRATNSLVTPSLHLVRWLHSQAIFRRCRRWHGHRSSLLLCP